MGMAGEDIAKGNMSVGDFVVVNTFCYNYIYH